MTGRCHCGGVVFRVDTPVPSVGLRCNCSFCSRRGWTHAAAKPAEFAVVEGEELLCCYRFGPGRSQNFFCRVCGIHTHFLNTYDDPPDYKYSLACCDEVDLDGLEIVWIDGRAY